jgi:Asp/Glu/hydantoin racemase
MSSATATVRLHQAVAGTEIGVLTLDTRHPLVPGNVQHAGSFGFPVRYEIVGGISGAALMRGEPHARAAIVTGAKALEAAGVRAIAGACGSFANYQTAVASAVHIPVYMSILLEVPLLLRALPPARKLGVVFASTTSFTARVREECGILENDRIVAIGADSIPAFRNILAQDSTLDSPALEAGIVALCQATLRREPTVGAWLLQCSDLPPYAHAVQHATGLPVFDMVTLIDRIHGACRPRMFER